MFYSRIASQYYQDPVQSNKLMEIVLSFDSTVNVAVPKAFANFSSFWSNQNMYRWYWILETWKITILRFWTVLIVLGYATWENFLSKCSHLRKVNPGIRFCFILVLHIVRLNILYQACYLVAPRPGIFKQFIELPKTS